ncbi:MAG: hypothetical protein ACKVOP_12045 [Sphingomonadaceae bacterium]
MLALAIFLGASQAATAAISPVAAFQAACLNDDTAQLRSQLPTASADQLPDVARRLLGSNFVDVHILAQFMPGMVIRSPDNLSNTVLRIGDRPDGFVILPIPGTRKQSDFGQLCAVVYQGTDLREAIAAMSPKDGEQYAKAMTRGKNIPRYFRRVIKGQELSVEAVDGWISLGAKKSR